jgi:hypothetical protein
VVVAQVVQDFLYLDLQLMDKVEVLDFHHQSQDHLLLEQVVEILREEVVLIHQEILEHTLLEEVEMVVDIQELLEYNQEQVVVPVS